MLHARNVIVMMKKETSVPEDFPKDPFPSSVSGAQQKLSVRLIDGKYIQRLSDDERFERFEICADLVEQLVVYCRRKHAERPEETLDSLLKRVEFAVRAKGWDVSPIELTWCFARSRDKL